jgi:hypothetical protein
MPHCRVTLFLAATCLAAAPPEVVAQKHTVRRDGVVVHADGIPKEYAGAIARTVAAARAAAAKDGFDMPAEVEVRVTADPARGSGLFNDGDRAVFLNVRSDRDLRKPADSGVFVVYGLCHEVAHLAMYRPVADRRWMTTAAAEGWAHYQGSHLVDRVADTQGADLWPDRYPYADDGTARLKRQLAGKDSSPTVRGAALWQDLADAVGSKGMVTVFAAWGKAKPDLADPAKALGEALAAAVPADRRDGVAKWWAGAKAAFVAARPASDFKALTAKPADLTGKPRELAHDDGTAAGKRSIAGGGHAVRFDAPGDGWYLTAVRVHGSRYGTPEAPDEPFTVYLCDDKLRTIAAFPFPYASFRRGQPEWVTLDVPPTQVPARFAVVVEFNPTARKGVFVDHDAAGGGRSLVGLPGEKGQPFPKGDWMIRPVLDSRQLEAAPAAKPR